MSQMCLESSILLADFLLQKDNFMLRLFDLHCIRCYTVCRQSMDIVITEVENILTSIFTWFNQNGMVANPAKFQMMFLGKRRYQVTSKCENNRRG